MSRLSKHHFWEWFKRHNQEYLTLKNKSKKDVTYWLNELDAHLRAYFKFFGFSLEWGKEPPATLTITAYGKAKHFKKVEALVAMAPEIPGWTTVALEGTRPIDFLLEQKIEETGIDPRELRFSFLYDDPNHGFLIVYHSLCTPHNEHLIRQIAHTAVYNLLGERSFGINIRKLEVANLSTADPATLKELETLPDCIVSSVMVIDSEGNLVSKD